MRGVAGEVGVSARGLGRYAWGGGILSVVALLSESVIAVGVKASQDDSAAKIANQLHDHHQRLVTIACISIFYAIGFASLASHESDVQIKRGTAQAPGASL